MILRTLAVLAGAASALGACATGGGGARSDEPIRALLSADVMMFVSFDADADLTISAVEIEAGMVSEFARADANRDASLQPIEFQAWANAALGGGQMGPYRLDFDRNVDNIITRQEFDTEMRARVSDYDADENGALTRLEFVRRIGQARPPSVRRPPIGEPVGPGSESRR